MLTLILQEEESDQMLKECSIVLLEGFFHTMLFFQKIKKTYMKKCMGKKWKIWG